MRESDKSNCMKAMLEIGFSEVELRFREKKSFANTFSPMHSGSLEQKYWSSSLFPFLFFYLYKYFCRYVHTYLFIFIYILRICTYTHTSTHVNMYTYIHRDRASRHSKSQEQASLLFFTAHQYSTAQEGQACTGVHTSHGTAGPITDPSPCFITQGSPREPLWAG